MSINVGRSPVRSNPTPSTASVERAAPRAENMASNASVRSSVDEFVSNEAKTGPVINPESITLPPSAAESVGSTQEAQEALRSLSAALEPFRAQLDELASKIPPDLKNDEGGLRKFLKEGLERLGIHPRDFGDAIDHIQKVHSTNRDRITS